MSNILEKMGQDTSQTHCLQFLFKCDEGTGDNNRYKPQDQNRKKTIPIRYEDRHFILKHHKY